MEMWLNTNFFWRENSNIKSYSDRCEKVNCIEEDVHPKWRKMSYIIIYDYYVLLVLCLVDKISVICVTDPSY